MKYLPLPIIQVVNFWVVLYFYLTSRQKRCYIAEYQQKLTALFPETKLPKYAVFRQFLAFGEAITDRFAVWQKKFVMNILSLMMRIIFMQISAAMVGTNFGFALILAILRSVGLCSVADSTKIFKLNVLVHNRHAAAFNKTLGDAGADELPLIQVEDLNVQKNAELAEKIDRGEWVRLPPTVFPAVAIKRSRSIFGFSSRVSSRCLVAGKFIESAA